MTVTVYSDMIDEVKKKLESVRKKAEKYGSSFSYEIGEPYVAEIGVLAYDPGEHVQYKKDTIHVEAVDIRCDDEMIRKDGWSAVAKIEHLEEGNLVTVFDGSGYPETWHTIAPYCEHCKTNHQRTVTYMVQNMDGLIRQVGSSCLHDYTGIDPRLAMSFAALVNYIEEEAGVDPETYREGSVGHLLSVKQVIELACKAIRKYGYRKSGMPDSTKGWIYSKYDTEEPDPEDKKLAKEIIDWLENEEQEVFSYQWECVPIVKQKYCKAEHIGRLAWLPVAWKKELERRERKAQRDAEREAAAAVSSYIGSIGERVKRDIQKADLITSWENQWGITYLYKFVDTEGNVLVWFSSNRQDIDGVKKLTGTVKDHSERDGVKQTIVTRCNLTVEKPEPKPVEKTEAEKAIDELFAFWNGEGEEEDEFGIDECLNRQAG